MRGVKNVILVYVNEYAILSGMKEDKRFYGTRFKYFK